MVPSPPAWNRVARLCFLLVMVGLGIEIVGLGFGKYAQKVRICLLNLKSPRLDLALDVCARVSEAVLSTFY
jgi:hypothetical protein